MFLILFFQPVEVKLVISYNVDESFLTLNPIKYLLPFFDPVERDIKEYEGQLRPLPEVILN